MRPNAKIFNQMSLEDKKTLVNSYAKWIFFFDANNYRVSVFELGGEIIEVWYNNSNRSIVKIKIPTYEELDMYLDDITLPLIRMK